MQTVIISRHPAVLVWLEKHHPELCLHAQVITGNATEEDVVGKRVVGNVPLSLASLALEVQAIEFKGAPPRGVEYTVDDMEVAGARLRGYVVERLA